MSSMKEIIDLVKASNLELMELNKNEQTVILSAPNNVSNILIKDFKGNTPKDWKLVFHDCEKSKTPNVLILQNCLTIEEIPFFNVKFDEITLNNCPSIKNLTEQVIQKLVIIGETCLTEQIISNSLIHLLDINNSPRIAAEIINKAFDLSEEFNQCSEEFKNHVKKHIPASYKKAGDYFAYYESTIVDADLLDALIMINQKPMYQITSDEGKAVSVKKLKAKFDQIIMEERRLAEDVKEDLLRLI